MIWSLGVSFVIIEIMKDQLFTLLTTKPLSWPKSLAELHQHRAEYDFVSTNVVFMKSSGNSLLQDLAKVAVYQDVAEPVVTLEYLASGRGVLLGRSLEIETFSETLSAKMFAFLDDKFQASQYSFYVSRKLPFHQQLIQV